jgi:hypothetical protein
MQKVACGGRGGGVEGEAKVACRRGAHAIGPVGGEKLWMMEYLTPPTTKPVKEPPIFSIPCNLPLRPCSVTPNPAGNAT